MSQIVAGGDTAATVVGAIVQEIDESKTVEFQWRSWDHFDITDAAIASKQPGMTASPVNQALLTLFCCRS